MEGSGEGRRGEVEGEEVSGEVGRGGGGGVREVDSTVSTYNPRGDCSV